MLLTIIQLCKLETKEGIPQFFPSSLPGVTYGHMSLKSSASLHLRCCPLGPSNKPQSWYHIYSFPFSALRGERDLLSTNLICTFLAQNHSWIANVVGENIFFNFYGSQTCIIWPYLPWELVSGLAFHLAFQTSSGSQDSSGLFLLQVFDLNHILSSWHSSKFVFPSAPVQRLLSLQRLYWPPDLVRFSLHWHSLSLLYFHFMALSTMCNHIYVTLATVVSLLVCKLHRSGNIFFVYNCIPNA